MISKIIKIKIKNKINNEKYMGVGDWAIGEWGLGMGPTPQSPIPNPQSPIPIII